MLAPLALAALALAGVAAASPPPGSTHLVTGEIARVHIPRRLVTVKMTGPPREMDVAVGEETVISTRGRPLRLEDIRPGERVAVVCADDGPSRHRARRIKIGR